MSQTVSVKLDAGGRRFAIVASRFNDFVTRRMVAGAEDALERHGAADADIQVVWVPGAFELPLVAQQLAESGRFDALVCVGCLIRGETPHFDYIAAEATKGVAQVAMRTGVPCGFGVVTANTLEQAIDRAGGKAGNKGAEAALAALETASLLKTLKEKK